MKTKTKNFLTCAAFMLLMALVVLLAVFTDKPVTASAATNVSSLCTVQGRVEQESGKIDITNNFSITMQSLSTTGSSLLPQNVKLDWTYVSIKVNVKSIRGHKSFTLLKDGEEFEKKTLSGKSDIILYSGNLPDGNYKLTYGFSIQKGVTTYPLLTYTFSFSIDTTAPKYELKAGGIPISSGLSTNKNISFSASDINFRFLYVKKPQANVFITTTDTVYNVDATASNSGWWEFYATDTLGQASQKVKLYLDLVPPTLSCSAGVMFGGTTGKSFIVTASDGFGKAKLYVKFESEEWFSSGDRYTVTDTERNGRYYFYAEDENGNRSDTTWIVLSTEDPTGSLIKSDTDNSVSFVWNNQYWSAKLDGENYTEGRFISDEGQHEIILSNNALKTKKYTFKIEHYYKIVSQTAATCQSNGVKNYECSQCGDTYEEVLYSSGHRYSITSTPSNCTESEHITYTCDLCGAKYETEGNFPSGHNYVSVVTKAPTCTSDGERSIKCEKCGDQYTTKIAANGHDYQISDTTNTNGKTIRTYSCSACGHNYKQELGDQYEEVSNYVEYLFEQYEPYMWWVLIAAAGVWSIVIGVMIAIAQKNEDKEKARKMLINYVIGLVVIAVIVVACPFLIRGIAALVT